MFKLRAIRSTDVDYEMIWGCLGLFTLAAAWAHPYWAATFSPRCAMKEVLGVPCLLCGGTRAMSAFTHAHLAKAWTWNPLVAAGSVALVLYLIYAWTALVLRSERRVRFDPQGHAGLGLAHKAVCALVFVALTSNWAYLIAAGR